MASYAAGLGSRSAALCGAAGLLKSDARASEGSARRGHQRGAAVCAGLMVFLKRGNSMSEVDYLDDADGIIFVGDNPAPESEAQDGQPDDVSEWGDDLDHRDVPDRDIVYKRALFKYKDPTTPPHVRKKCVKKFKYPGGWTCTGWKIQYRWLYRIGTLEVTTVKGVEVKAVLEDCLKEGAIAGLIAAIVSQGSAAGPAAAAAIKTCLVRKLSTGILDVSIRFTSKRGDWS